MPNIIPLAVTSKFKSKFIDFEKTKFKFIDFEKTKFKFIDFEKTNSNLLTLQTSNSNSSKTGERIQIQSNPTFHTKASKRILHFAPSKSQSQMSINASQVRNKLTTQVA